MFPRRLRTAAAAAAAAAAAETTQSPSTHEFNIQGAVSEFKEGKTRVG